MKTLNEATQRICDLKGDSLALTCAINAVFRMLTPDQASAVLQQLQDETEICRNMLLHAPASDRVLQRFEHVVQQVSASLHR